MNIFLLDRDPAIAATYHINRHVVKQILETAQMLSYVQEKYNPNIKMEIDPSLKLAGLSKTHHVHPCTIWLTKSLSNYMYGLNLLKALIDEKSFRYPDRPEHSIKTTTLPCLIQPPKNIPDIGYTDAPQCFGSHNHLRISYTSDPLESSIRAYRQYYIHAKRFDKNGKPMAFWGNRQIPIWFEEGIKNVKN